MTNMIDTVPEHDEDHPVTSATPSPAPEATPEATSDATAPEAPANPAPTPVAIVPLAPAPRTGNAAWASEKDRATITALHAAIRRVGYTRPMITQATGFNDSRVYLAQHDRAQYHEVEAWLTYFKSLPRDEAGNFLPAPGSKQAKPKIEDVQRELDAVKADLQAKIDEAVAALSVEDAKTVKQLRDVVQAARDALVGTKVEAPAEADATV
jgi:hypothetical protein